MSKYNITSKESLLAKILVAMAFILTVILLIVLWGVSWLSGLFLIAFSIFFIDFYSSLQFKPFQCSLSDNGFIEIEKPILLTGKISASSFYNTWVIFLCIEEYDTLLPHDELKCNQSKKWFFVFNDSVNEQHYRLIARLIISARWS